MIKLLRSWMRGGKLACEHDWQYMERKPGETYTGYCEQCSKCGAIYQIVQ